MTITTELNEQNRLDITGRAGYLRLHEGGAPISPGNMLLLEFLEPLGVSQRQLADAMHLSYRHVNAIVNGRRPITPAVALRLARYIGPSVGFWLNCQLAWDLHHTLKSEEDTLRKIQPLPRPDLPELLKLAGLEEEDNE